MTNIDPRKIISALILIAGVGTAVYLGSETSEKTSKEKFLASIEAIKNKDPLLAYEKSLSTDSSEPSRAVSGKTPDQTGGDLATNNNLTDNLAKLYLEEIAKRNPTLAGAETLTLPSESSLDELVAAQITQGIKSKTYTRKDIRISEVSGLSAERVYLESFAATTQKNFKNVSRGLDSMIGALFEKKNQGPLRKYVEAASAEIADLLALETPKTLVGLHLEILNLWQKKISVYDALLDSENDPLRSYLALQSIESIIYENETLDKKLGDLAKKFNS